MGDREKLLLLQKEMEKEGWRAWSVTDLPYDQEGYHMDFAMRPPSPDEEFRDYYRVTRLSYLSLDSDRVKLSCPRCGNRLVAVLESVTWSIHCRNCQNKMRGQLNNRDRYIDMVLGIGPLLLFWMPGMAQLNKFIQPEFAGYVFCIGFLLSILVGGFLRNSYMRWRISQAIAGG